VAATAVSVVALAVASEASAQRHGVTAVVLNYEQVIGQSALGRDMTTKLQAVRQQITQEAQALQPEQQAIETERQRLATAAHGMTTDQIHANATLAPQFDAFTHRLQQFQTRAQSLQGDLECSQAIALRDFDRQAGPIVRSAMQAQGAGVVLDGGGVRQFDPTADITATVIQQLDQGPTTRTANVARHAVSECQPPAGAPPAAH
jgi:Skp family chaperone for outer membrane proteins